MMKTNDSTKTVRAGLYARVSTSGHGQDVGLQLDELRAVAQQRGWHAVEYVDEGISGSTASRPALDKMMVDARSGRIDVVLVWRFDRFARSTSHLLAALEEFRTLGVGFISTREQIDTTTALGKVLFTLVAAISEFERTLIVERVQAGVDRARAAGKHCGRPVVQIDLRPGGHDKTLKATFHIGVGFDLDGDDAMEALRAWNARCQPPWSRADLAGMITGARRNGGSSLGFHLTERVPVGVSTFRGFVPHRQPVLVGEPAAQPASGSHVPDDCVCREGTLGIEDRVSE